MRNHCHLKVVYRVFFKDSVTDTLSFDFLASLSPVSIYLWVKNDQVELRDASHLWGKTTRETNHLLWKELGDREIRVFCIGPAGENLVPVS